MRRLAILALFLAACSQSPQYQPQVYQPQVYQPAPSQTVSDDVRATRDAAQLRLDAESRATEQAQAATQGVINATMAAIDIQSTATAAEIDNQRAAIDMQLTAQSVTATQQAMVVGVKLTALYVHSLESAATETAVYRGIARDNAINQAQIDMQGAKVSRDAIGALQMVLIVAVGWGLFQLVQVAAQRWRAKPIIANGPDGPIIFQLTAPQPPQVKEPELPYQNKRALEFLDACLLYRIRRPEFPADQIPSDDRLAEEGIDGWSGGTWQRMIDSFGNMLELRRLTGGAYGTFCKEHSIAELREHIASGYYQLPYPIAAPVPRRSTVPVGVGGGGDDQEQ